MHIFIKFYIKNVQTYAKNVKMKHLNVQNADSILPEIWKMLNALALSVIT